jgi:endogenous inhibitor of DNA gyrase (YacG/DUF329 family)
MAKKKTISLRCPTCRQIVLAKDEHFPFCSNRCRVIDLGKWISGGYVISTPVNDPESGGEAEYTDGRQHASGEGSARSNPSSQPGESDVRKPN